MADSYIELPDVDGARRKVRTDLVGDEHTPKHLNPDLAPVTQGASVDLAFTGSSAQSSAITGTLIRLCATESCRVLIASNPTALATSMLLPAGAIEYLKITSGHKVAAIQESTGGDLNIMVCA